MIVSKNPLVSIIVITYNSSKFVLETLESVNFQRYPFIELIVSDDFSDDETTHICRNWLNQNNKRFIRTELITSASNTGVSGNCNRGLYASTGDWIKLIGGDDILLPECISTNIEFTKNNPEANFIFSSMISFYKNGTNIPYPINNYFNLLSSRKQFEFLLKNPNPVYAPTSFIRRTKLVELGGFDENYPKLEDVPLWLKATNEGQKLYFHDGSLVKYRIHEGNSSFSKEFRSQSESNFYDNVVLDLIFKNRMYLYYWHRKLQILMIKYRSSLVLRSPFVRRIFFLLDPYLLFSKVFVSKKS